MQERAEALSLVMGQTVWACRGESQSDASERAAKCCAGGGLAEVTQCAPEATGVMGGDLNTVHLITREGQEDWPLLPKQAVAERLARRIADHFSTAKAAE